MPREALFEMKNIYKSFHKNHVLKGINLSILPGEVHAIVGENGAGKSTLIKIMTGAHGLDNGDLIWQGEKVTFRNPIEAMTLGIAPIYQELNAVPDLLVYENIFLGRELKKNGKWSLLDRAEMLNQAQQILIRLGQDPKLATEKQRTLGIGMQQLVEIAKALILDAKILIMDEPTSSLSGVEVEQLVKIIEQLRSEGIAIVFISHRLEEVRRIADRVTVLRDGRCMKTLDAATSHMDYWIELMVGRTLDEKYPKKNFNVGEVGFRLENFQVDKDSPPLDLALHYGELVGISGLVGAGRTELARAIFGADKRIQGNIYLDGEVCTVSNPKQAIEAGIAFITEDRKSEGLLLDLPLDSNICLASMKQFKGHLGLLKIKQMKQQACEYMDDLHIMPNDLTQHARYLSGGNQQKVVIAKWLCTQAKVFIFDEPTRGIDIGAKVEVYRLMNRLIEEHAIVLMISSDLPEIMGMCDRVLVMNRGEITADLPIAQATQEKIMLAATVAKQVSGGQQYEPNARLSSF